MQAPLRGRRRHKCEGMASRFVFFGAAREPCLFYEEGRAIPKLEEGEVLAKIRLATICGSDLHTISGKRIEAVPSVLGHEAVAEVVENRRSNSHLKIGDRITFSVADSCGNCSMCTADLPQKCKRLKKYGHLSLSNHGAGFNGCYASHIVLCPGTAIFRLPDHVSDRLAAPINCALATMVNAVESIPLNPHYKVAVIQGAGLLGLYGCALLKERGFEEVWCMDVNQNRLLLVPRFGGRPLNSSMYKLHGDGPEPNSVDAVIEVCGSKSVVKDGLYFLRPGGFYIFVGLVHSDSLLDLTGEELIRKCLTITGIHNYAPRHLQQAIEFISRTCTHYPYDSLLSPAHALKDLPTAIQLANGQHFTRVAVIP